MKRRRILLMLALVMVIAAAGLLLFQPRGPKEPVYGGKTFFQWAQAKENAMTPEQDAAANAGLKAIGTNALPFLMHDFTRSIDDLQLIQRAAHGLSHLGSNAAPAVPVVARYLGDSIRGPLAAKILGYTGEPAVPELCAAVHSANALAITNAISALRRLRAKSEAADQTIRKWEAANRAPPGP